MIYSEYKPNTKNEKVGKTEFVKLTKTEKVSYLFNSGEFLLTREHPGYLINLYLLADFFVEIWYTSPSNRVDKIEVVPNDEVLENYNDEIDLSSLF